MLDIWMHRNRGNLLKIEEIPEDPVRDEGGEDLVPCWAREIRIAATAGSSISSPFYRVGKSLARDP